MVTGDVAPMSLQERKENEKSVVLEGSRRAAPHPGGILGNALSGERLHMASLRNQDTC